jgi:hypothetical protein
MRLLVLVSAAILVALVGIPAAGTHVSSYANGLPAAKKKCHYVTKKVHGKKKRVKAFIAKVSQLQ